MLRTLGTARKPILTILGEVTELAESTGLENRRRFIPTVGSNPTLSAKFKKAIRRRIAFFLP